MSMAADIRKALENWPDLIRRKGPKVTLRHSGEWLSALAEFFDATIDYLDCDDREDAIAAAERFQAARKKLEGK